MEMEMKEYDLIFVFAFGAPETLESNKRLANCAERVFKGQIIKTPLIITQEDIPISVPHIIAANDEKYLSSLGIIIYAKRRPEIQILWRNKKPLKILVIAVGPHLKRCVRDVKKIFPGHIVQGKSPYNDFPFCKESTQQWTRSWLSWWPRELILRILPWPIYKKLAG